MFRMNPNEIRRQLKKLGIKNVNINNVEAEEVIIRTTEGREIVAVNPQVVIMEIPGANAMIQILATELIERSEQPKEQQISEEDIAIVMDQTGASREEAIQALRETEGDIAAAILLIEERRRANEAS